MSISEEGYSKNYIRLAQLYIIICSFSKKDEKTKAIQNVLQDDGDINYQIPENTYFKAIQPDWIGYTALHLSIEKHQLEIFKIFIQHGADFTIKNCKNDTPLHQGIRFGNNNQTECWKLIGKIHHPYTEVILSAHVDRNISSNPCNNFGLSHFHIACMTNHAKAVEYFLKNGISANESIPSDSPVLPGFTALHIAARYCAVEATEILLNYGADVCVTDSLEMTPMHILMQRNMQIADWINLGSRSSYDVFQTEFDSNKKIIKLLLEKNEIFSSSKVDNIGVSWLHVACVLQDMSMLQRAINHNGMQKTAINLDSPVWPGYTALYFAAHFSMNAIKFLLTKGADIMAKDAKGITPFDLCLQRYEAEDLYFILTSQLSWRSIQLSDGKTNLVDLVLAMRSHNNFKTFITKSVQNLNVFIPRDSKLWPGYTLLHLAIVFKDRSNDINDLYENTDYPKDDCTQTSYNCTKIEQDIFLQRIKVCLSLGVDVTMKDSCGLTPLHHAFHQGNEKIINLLLKKHPKRNINHVADDGLSHLHIACAVGNATLVIKLLSNGANVNGVVRSRYSFKTGLNTEEGIVFYKFTISPGFTPLHIAIAAGNNRLAQLLIIHGANIYATDCNGLTPVHLTMITSYTLSKQFSVIFESIDLLTSANLKDCVSTCGLSHLHVACQRKKVNAVKKLLKLGANVAETIHCNVDETSYLHVFLKTYDGYQPIHFAIENLSAEMIELLSARGADILSKAANNSIPFYQKLYTRGIFNRTEFFRTFLARMPSLRQRLSELTGITMLHVACETVSLSSVKKLLNDGANPNAQVRMDSPIWPGWTPLHNALYKCHNDTDQLEDIIELLMKHGADITIKNAKQNTPLHEAFMGSFMDDYPSVELPIKAHRDFSVNPVNAHGISHFHIACFANDTNAIDYFMMEQEDIACQPIDYFSEYFGGKSALHLAAHRKDEDAIEMLIDCDAFDVDARDSGGWTVLHVAASDGYGIEISKEFLKMLIEESRNPNAQTFYGKTALELLLQSHTAAKGTVELFLERGSSVNIFNNITGEGYIGIMACNNLDGLDAIEKHPFYKGVIDAPKRNEFDHMGRTPIHNIVSYHFDSLGPENYAKLIEGFVKVGCDINHQDDNGRTALHSACQLKNCSGMIGLLMNGINVNLLDFEGNSAFMYCLKPGKSKSRNPYTIRKVKEHLQKLKIFGLYVNKLNEEILKKIPKSTCNIDDEIKCWQEEMKKLKGKKIEPHSIYLADFLSETGMVVAYSNIPANQRQDIDTFFETNSQQLFDDFPVLIGLILLQYRKALIREAFLEPARVSFNLIVGFPVPHVCVYVIFRFLANEDLKNLIAAVE